MSLSNKFVDNVPKLDLHGESSDTARVMINDFINDNIKLKNEIIVIVHGIGTGILKNTTHNILKMNKNVLEYQIDFYNNGSTIVRLKI